MAAPAEIAQDERVAQVVMAILVTPLDRVHTAPVVLLSIDEPPLGILGLHVGARHFTLSIEDARLLAQALRRQPQQLALVALSAGIEAAANMVDLMEARAVIRDLMDTRLPAAARALS
jgi:hypothetical protein